jgi:hypothetical protein
MSAPDPSLPPKPDPPDPGDCCGSGCQRCVLDIYDEQLTAWEEAVAALRARATETPRPEPGD